MHIDPTNDSSIQPDPIPTGNQPQYLPSVPNAQGDIIFDSPPPILRRRFGVKRWLIAGGVVVALGAAVAVGINAVPTLAASISSTPTSGTHGPGHRGPGGHGFGGPSFGGPGGGLTVTAVGSDTITVTGRNGTTVTIHTTSSTTYTRAGKTISASAIAKGDTIAVRGTRNSDGSVNATVVQIVLPSYDGKVTAISGSTITIQSHRGTSTTYTIHVASDATIQRGGQSTTLSTIAVGDSISATGTVNSDKSLDAEQIEISVPRASGTITAISGADITVKDPFGGTLVVHTTGVTTFVSITKGTNGPAQTTIALSALKVGDTISATGTRNSDGSLNALAVQQLPAGVNGGPHLGGPGGPSGNWGGKPGQGDGTPPASN